MAVAQLWMFCGIVLGEVCLPLTQNHRGGLRWVLWRKLLGLPIEAP